MDIRTNPSAPVGRAPRDARAPRTTWSSGFTLVELLVVIVILGVLSGVVVFAVSGATSTAAASACKSDVKTVESGLEAWRALNAGYPSTGAAGQTQLTTGADRTLKSWPSSSSYTITLDATVPGQLNVTIPGGSPIAVGVAGQPNPCDALANPTSGSTASSSPSTSTSTSTTSTSTTTTTTAPAGNGVTVTPSVASSTSAWYGENQLALTNSAPMTSLSITIKVARTPGVAYQGQYTTFWGNTITLGHATTSSTVDFTFTNSVPSIVAGSWTIAAQFSGTGTPRVTSGDTWAVTSTSGGVTRTLNGHF